MPPRTRWHAPRRGRPRVASTPALAYDAGNGPTAALRRFRSLPVSRGRHSHGRRLQPRLRPDRPRRRHGRLHGRVPGRAAGHARGARRSGQDRRHVPARRLHPDQGAPRIGRVVRPAQEGQGIRDRAGGPAGVRLRGHRQAPRPGRQADVDGPAEPGRQEQGDLDRRAGPVRGADDDSSRAQRRGRDAGRWRRAGRHGEERDHRHGQPGEEPAGPRARRPPDHHLGRRDHQGRPAEVDRHRRRGRGRFGVRLALPRPGRGRNAARVPARHRAARGQRRQRRRWSEASPAAASRS